MSQVRLTLLKYGIAANQKEMLIKSILNKIQERYEKDKTKQK